MVALHLNIKLAGPRTLDIPTQEMRASDVDIEKMCVRSFGDTI
jgi:hypothetical protein